MADKRKLFTIRFFLNSVGRILKLASVNANNIRYAVEEIIFDFFCFHAMAVRATLGEQAIHLKVIQEWPMGFLSSNIRFCLFLPHVL